MPRAAIFIDGDNLSPSHAPELLSLAQRHGRFDIARVYGDTMKLGKWLEVDAIRAVHAGPGKNGADILLALDAMDLCLPEAFETVVLASSDCDFSHLAERLRERGVAVVGAGEEKTKPRFREACTEFLKLGYTDQAPKTFVSKIDRLIYEEMRSAKRGAAGIPLALLGSIMGSKHDVKKSALEARSWRAYLAARQNLFEINAEDGIYHVRYLPKAFAKLA